ncbi:MAG TPA: hypothetical protein VFL94_10105 [Actinomycetales bacterium]|nr:hypothetical protein [Actinomycetales bacterium]
MSIRSLTDLAVARDVAPRGEEVASQSPGRKNERQTDTLISSIPAEVLVLYTAVTSGALATAIKDHPGSYLPYRWVLLATSLLITPVAVWKTYRTKYRARRLSQLGLEAVVLPADRRDRRAPWLEMTAATVAAAAWFLAAPGSPLLAQMTATVAQMTSVTILVGATAVLWAGFSRPLKLGSAVSPQVPQNAADAAAHRQVVGGEDVVRDPATLTAADR